MSDLPATRRSGDTPRIRHITGIRIQQLTLPEALPLSSKLLPKSPILGYTLGESSKSPNLTSSPERLHRQLSSASTRTIRRDRSTSTATIEAPTHRSRTRARAPTLAGEVLEGGHSVLGLSRSIYEEEDVKVESRRLARCFVVLKVVPVKDDSPMGNGQDKRTNPYRKGSDDKQGPDEQGWNGDGHVPQRASRPKAVTRTSSSSSSSTSISRRPTLSTNSSTRSISTNTSPTTSTTASHYGSTNNSRIRTISSPATTKPSIPSTTNRRPSTTSSMPNGNTKGRLIPQCNPTSTVPAPSISRNQSHRKPTDQPDPIITPFYISPIHHPSTHPRFLNLEPTSDFAPWLTTEELASGVVGIEVWYETENGWKVLEGVSRVVHLNSLRRKGDSGGVRGKGAETLRKEGDRSNRLEFTFDFDAKGVYYLPGEDESVGNIGAVKEDGNDVLERSIRETRMKKGIGVEALHQLVNIQSVVVDTQRGIEHVQARIDRLIVEDVDWRALHRDINERGLKVGWMEEKIAEVEKITRGAQARIVLLQQTIQARRDNLIHAGEGEQLLIGRSTALESTIQSIETERMHLLPQIHHYRSHHVQSLDTLFPILPLDPSILLYSILDIPLPIPTGSKDPAPPLSLPLYKVDERSTAAALGYVGMVAQVLGNILGGGGGGGGGVVYPITGFGSRSLVRDVVSVMQGPRSFPLYTKGVEGYRFEYAVFLLNKNIEMLMQESQIRLLDIRHTLPNLKALLLTLSSPTAPPALNRRPVATRSTNSSRQTSTAWSFARSPTVTSLDDVRSGIGGSPLKSSQIGHSPLVRRNGYEDGIKDDDEEGGGAEDLGQDNMAVQG